MGSFGNFYFHFLILDGVRLSSKESGRIFSPQMGIDWSCALKCERVSHFSDDYIGGNWFGHGKGF